MMVALSPQPDLVVLTAAGREHVQRRLDRALEALASVADRMSSGEHSADEVAEHQRLLQQVEQLSVVLARAADVATVDEDPTVVEVGDEVVVETDDGSVDVYALVHAAEASVAERRISAASPLGRAVLGGRAGDRVIVDAPAGAYACVIQARRRLE